MYYEKLYVNKPDNLDEMTKDKSSFSGNILNISTSIKEMQFVVKNLLTTKTSQTKMGSLVNFAKHLRKKKKNST